MNNNLSTGSQSDDQPRPTELHAIDWAIQAGAADDVLRELTVRRRRRVGVVGGAAVALAMAGMIAYFSVDRPSAVEASRVVGAPVSLPARQLLPDGTLVELRDGAELAPAFTSTVRLVVLNHGEAFFHVAKDPRKPFVVQARGVQVRAVGTAFTVGLGRATVDVVVTEGRVALDRAAGGTAVTPGLAAGPDTIALVDAGNRAAVGPADLDGAEVSAISKVELDARLAWLAPRLDLSNSPLAEVVATMNRTGRVQLALASADLGQIRLSGMIRADNVDTLVRLLEEGHGIKAERRGETEIVLSRAR